MRVRTIHLIRTRKGSKRVPLLSGDDSIHNNINFLDLLLKSTLFRLFNLFKLVIIMIFIIFFLKSFIIWLFLSLFSSLLLSCSLSKWLIIYFRNIFLKLLLIWLLLLNFTILFLKRFLTLLFNDILFLFSWYLISDFQLILRFL